MSYLGRSAKLSLKAQEKVSFLATAGQTVKTGLSYTPSFIEVYVNGVLLTDTTDFTATNGNSVTFTVALLLNDEVTVISLKTFTVADHYTKSDADTLLAAKATVANFTSTGIDDNATSTKVTVSNTGVEVTGDITLTSAGSIKTQGTDMLLGTADTGIRFYDQTNSIYPVNVTSGSDRDNAVDLGHSSVRFKDLHLSGGVVFGPASASNVSSQTLDSYEEGSFTASIRDAPSGGNAQSIGTQYYTKIGNQVTVWILRDNITISGLTSNNTFFFTGLPFTSASTTVSVGSIWWQYINTGNTHVVAPRISPNVSYIRFDELRDNANDTGVTVGALNNNASDILVTITYQAA